MLAAFSCLHEIQVQGLADILTLATGLGLFRSGRAGTAKVRALVMKIGDMRKELRFLHLDARLRTRFELTRGQLARYVKLRDVQS